MIIVEQRKETFSSNKVYKPQRIKAIETVRGIATFFMVFGHFTLWFINKKILLSKVFYFWYINLVMNLGFPFFIIVNGITLSFAISRRLEKNSPLSEILKYIFKRGLIIITISILFNIAVYNVNILGNPLLLIDWNILAQIGLAYIITALILILKIPNPSYIILGFGFLILDTTFLGVEPGLHVVAYMLIGAFLGDCLIKSVKKQKMKQFQLYLLIIGILIFITTAPFELSIAYINLDQFLPPYPWLYKQWIYYIFSTGVLAILFSLLLEIQDIKKKNWRIFEPIMLIGNLSLTLFTAHFIFAVYFFLPLNLYNYFWVFTFHILGLSMFILIYILAVFWSRAKFKYSLEWLLRG